MAVQGQRITGYVPDYVVFDLETTGISSVHDNIIEISALKVVGGQVADTLSTLVNPQRRIPPAASAVNGITDEMVAAAPLLDAVLEEFLTFTEGQVLVGHNIHSFDMKFIRRDALELFGRNVDNSYIDTLYMARNCLPQLKRHRLIDLAAHFQISSAGAHRALNDCIMNQKCFEELAKLQKNAKTDEKIEVCPKCGGELRKRSGKFGEFWGCGNFPGCRYTRNV